MSKQSSPFGGLDKLLFNPPQKSKPATKVSQSTKSNDQSSRPKWSTKTVDRNDKSKRSIKAVNKSSQSASSTKSVDRNNQPNQSTEAVDQEHQQLIGAVVKRPLAFYIPKAINERLERAVEYYQQNYHPKIDRSAVVSAILGDPNLWEEDALEENAKQVMCQLKNRMNDRVRSRLNQSTNLLD